MCVCAYVCVSKWFAILMPELNCVIKLGAFLAFSVATMSRYRVTSF